MTQSPVIKRITVFGGSIADGYGCNTSYAQTLAEMLNIEFRPYTAPHRYIDWSVENLCDITWTGDWVLIQHGLSEGFWRPKAWTSSILPKSMSRPGGLDPAPFLASTPWRRLRQRGRWLARALVRWIALLTFQSYRYMTPRQYAEQLDTLIRHLLEQPNVSRISLIGPSVMHRFYFPLANATLRRYLAQTRAVAARHGLRVLDIRPILDQGCYLADKVHPNEDGHRIIAADLLES